MIEACWARSVCLLVHLSVSFSFACNIDIYKVLHSYVWYAYCLAHALSGNTNLLNLATFILTLWFRIGTVFYKYILFIFAANQKPQWRQAIPLSRLFIWCMCCHRDGHSGDQPAGGRGGSYPQVCHASRWLTQVCCLIHWHVPGTNDNHRKLSCWNSGAL